MPKARVYELAQQLGLNSKAVLAALADLGEFVRSASSTIEAPTVRRLRVELDRRRRVGGAVTSQQGDLRRAARRSPFGEVTRSQDASERPLSFVEEAESLRSGRRRGPRSDQDMKLRWAERMFEPAEIQAWQASGLGQYDVGIAEQCRAAGLVPEDLGRVVDGCRLALRLTGGESVSSVRSRLRDQEERKAG